jgi:hypothetical protein
MVIGWLFGGTMRHATSGRNADVAIDRAFP